METESQPPPRNFATTGTEFNDDDGEEPKNKFGALAKAL